MTASPPNGTDPSRVGIASLPSASYGDGGGAIRAALGRLADELGWAAAGGGSFGAVVPEGARVLVKPN